MVMLKTLKRFWLVNNTCIFCPKTTQELMQGKLISPKTIATNNTEVKLFDGA